MILFIGRASCQNAGACPYCKGESLKQVMQIILKENQVGMKMIYRRKTENTFEQNSTNRNERGTWNLYVSKIKLNKNESFSVISRYQIYYYIFFYIPFSFLPDFSFIWSASPVLVSHPWANIAKIQKQSALTHTHTHIHNYNFDIHNRTCTQWNGKQKWKSILACFRNLHLNWKREIRVLYSLWFIDENEN